MEIRTDIRDTRTRTRLQRAAMLVALVFGLVGILGFIPGITTGYDSMQFAGHDSGAQLLGVFGVSVLHNIVHLLFAVAGIALSRTADGSKAFLIGGGVIYLVLAVYGVLIDRHSNANFVPLNDADNWLHLVLGLGMIGVGVALGNRGREAVGTDR